MEPTDASFWDAMLARRLSRRRLIKGLAGVSLGLAAPPGALRLPFALARGRSSAAPADSPSARGGSAAALPLDLHRFTPIRPTTRDELVLAREFDYRILLRWGDAINERGDRFGFNCDFTAFFPLPRPAPASPRSRADHLFFARRARVTEGLYVVNHEYPDPLFIPDVRSQKRSLGVSVVHLRRAADGEWRVETRSPLARRYDGRSTLRMSGPAASLAGKDRMVVGTMGNCSGGVTPWGTALSCEENTENYGEQPEDGGYGWGAPYVRVEHYSWVVEIDPYDPEWIPVKRTALGRFRHENVALRVGADGRVVLYMGDDALNRFVYKYVSAERYEPARGRANGDLLDVGQLYVAHCTADGKGTWTPLPMVEDCLRDTHAYIVEKNLPATPMDRPEDLEIHPLDGSVYVALTNNTNPAPRRVIPPLAPDPYGKVVRLVERGGDPAALSFSWELFAAGGRESGFAAPDNLEFDRLGNLWIITDFSGRDTYAPFGNNGMFMVPTRGRAAGTAFQFASGPVGCELTGPWLSPDETELFLAVQHPGEGSRLAAAPTSTWPDGKAPPRPSCVVIRRRQAQRR